MNNYLVILLGSALGMLLLICVKSVYIQRTSKYELGFIDAFKVYTTKYIGPMVVGGIVILIAMFVLPDVIANTQTDPENEKKYVQVLTKVIHWLRTFSVGIGLLAQGIGFMIVRRGEKYLREAEKKLDEDGK